MNKTSLYDKTFCDSVCGNERCKRNLLNLNIKDYKREGEKLTKVFLKNCCPDYVKPTKKQKKLFMETIQEL